MPSWNITIIYCNKRRRISIGFQIWMEMIWSQFMIICRLGHSRPVRSDQDLIKLKNTSRTFCHTNIQRLLTMSMFTLASIKFLVRMNRWQVQKFWHKKVTAFWFVSPANVMIRAVLFSLIRKVIRIRKLVPPAIPQFLARIRIEK